MSVFNSFNNSILGILTSRPGTMLAGRFAPTASSDDTQTAEGTGGIGQCAFAILPDAFSIVDEDEDTLMAMEME